MLKKELSVPDLAVESSSLVGSDQDLPITIATKPISTRDRNIAVGAIVMLVTLDAIVIPFAGIHLPRVDPFIPVIQTVMCAVDFLTAALLFAQYSIQPLRAVYSRGKWIYIQWTFRFYPNTGLSGSIFAGRRNRRWIK